MVYTLMKHDFVTNVEVATEKLGAWMSQDVKNWLPKGAAVVSYLKISDSLHYCIWKTEGDVTPGDVLKLADSKIGPESVNTIQPIQDGSLGFGSLAAAPWHH